MVLPCEKMVGDPAFRPVLGRGAVGARVFGIAIALLYVRHYVEGRPSLQACNHASETLTSSGGNGVTVGHAQSC